MAALGGTLQIVPQNGFKLQQIGRSLSSRLVAEIISRFANVEDGFAGNTILEPTVVYHANSVAVEAVQGSFAKFADHANLTPNERSVARALDSAANDPRANKLFNVLDYESLSKLPRDLQLTPDGFTSMPDSGRPASR